VNRYFPVYFFLIALAKFIGDGNEALRYRLKPVVLIADYAANIVQQSREQPVCRQHRSGFSIHISTAINCLEIRSNSGCV
jgi:hypothetical protein